MLLHAVWLLAIGLGAQMSSSLARTPWRGFIAASREVEGPTQAAAIFGLLGFVDELLWDVWASPSFLFALTCAFGLGFGHRRGRTFRLGALRARLRCTWLGWLFWARLSLSTGQRQQVETHRTVIQHRGQLFLQRCLSSCIFAESGQPF